MHHFKIIPRDPSGETVMFSAMNDKRTLGKVDAIGCADADVFRDERYLLSIARSAVIRPFWTISHHSLLPDIKHPIVIKESALVKAMRLRAEFEYQIGLAQTWIHGVYHPDHSVFNPISKIK